MKPIEWVRGPDLFTTLDFYEPGYFYLHNTDSHELFIVRVFQQKVWFYGEANGVNPRLMMQSHYRWAKVPFPVGGISLPKDFLKSQGW